MWEIIPLPILIVFDLVLAIWPETVQISSRIRYSSVGVIDAVESGAPHPNPLERNRANSEGSSRLVACQPFSTIDFHRNS